LMDPSGNPFAAASDTTVNYSVGGTASPGSQYAPLGTITIPAVNSSVNVPGNALDENQIDPTLRVTISLGSTSQYSVGGGSATCNIFDGDTRTLSVQSLSPGVGGSQN